MMEKVVVVVLLLFAGPAQANDNDNETVVIYGMGNTSCGTYVLALNENLPSVGLQWRGKHYYSNSAALWQWISGYISARNLAVSSDYQLKTDGAGIWQWLRKHCDANPTISLLRAANDLLDAHGIPRPQDSGLRIRPLER